MAIEKNPWKIHNAEKKYENPWIRVTEHSVTDPGGNPGIYGTVHYKNLAVGVVPWQNGEIWLVGQFRFPLEYYSWEIPEGGGPEGEDPLETARRELKEETGIEAKDFKPILEMDLSNSVSDEKGIVYLATGLSFGEPDPEADEDLRLKKVTLHEAFEMVERHEIRDSLTVAAIYKMMLLHTSGALD